MADIAYILLAAVALLLGTGAAYLWQEGRRRALASELEAARSARAVADSRLQDLDARHREQGTRLDAAAAEAQRLREESVHHKAALTEAERRREEALTQLAGTEAERRRLSDEAAALKAAEARLSAQNQDLRGQLEAQKGWVAEQTKSFEERVLAAAGKLMEERGRAFTELNRKEVDAVIAPFKEQLGEFRRRVDAIYTEDTRERAGLREHIVQLTTLNQAVSLQAQQLTHALTVQSKATGDWGETILEKILEDSGLRRDREYRLQHRISATEGELQRPDAVIFLPDDRQLVIDSKVSNKAWTEYCSAADDEERKRRLQEHLGSLRQHMKDLAGRNYAASPDLRTVDFVLMFVPVEAALLTALAKDSALYGDAYRSKVILVAPSTLMAVVKLVEGIWTLERRKESADEIAEAGRRLYDKLTTFAESFMEVGAAIGKAQTVFEKAQGQLATGKGNAIRLADRMRELGVTPSPGKVMPAGLLELGADDPEPGSAKQ